MARYVVETATTAVGFTCARCGERRLARVRSSGWGNLSSLQGESAGYAAATDERNANADRLLGCVSCPACGYVDPAHERGLMLRAAGIGIGICAVMTGLTWALQGAPTDVDDLIAFSVVFAACLVLFALPMFLVFRAQWWAGAVSKVSFDDPAPAVPFQGRPATRPPSPFDL